MLNLKEYPTDNKFLLRTKKGVLKNFKANSASRVDEAVILATYLYATGKADEAVGLLESFVHAVEYSPDREDLWSSVGRGVLLLAYIYGEGGNVDLEQRLVSIIARNDILSEDMPRAAYLAEELADHQDILTRYPEQSHKYRCQSLAQQSLIFIYFYELFPLFHNDVHASEKKVVAQIIQETSWLLKIEVTS